MYLHYRIIIIIIIIIHEFHRDASLETKLQGRYAESSRIITVRDMSSISAAAT